MEQRAVKPIDVDEIDAKIVVLRHARGAILDETREIVEQAKEHVAILDKAIDELERQKEDGANASERLPTGGDRGSPCDRAVDDKGR